MFGKIGDYKIGTFDFVNQIVVKTKKGKSTCSCKSRSGAIVIISLKVWVTSIFQTLISKSSKISHEKGRLPV